MRQSFFLGLLGPLEPSRFKDDIIAPILCLTPIPNADRMNRRCAQY